MSWFFEYVFPVVFIGAFIIIFLSIASTFFLGFSVFGRLFKSFDKFDNDIFKSFENMKAERSRNYQCKNCGAALGEKADVSPSGDVKCTYCNKWFNIHKNS
jgi:hypothetical protein